MPQSILADGLLPIRIIITANYQHEILSRNLAENRTKGYSLQQVSTYINAHRSESPHSTYAINIGTDCARLYRSAATRYALFEQIDSVVGFDSQQNLPANVRAVIDQPEIRRATDSLFTSDYRDKFLVIKHYGDSTTTHYLSAGDYSPARNFDSIYDLIRQFFKHKYRIATDTTLSAAEILGGSMEFFDCAHRFQLESSNSDISLIAANSFRDTISGKMDFRSLNKLFPYDNKLVKFRVKGSELLEILRYMVRGTYRRMTDKDGDLLRISADGTTLRAAHNIDCAGGIFWSIDVRRRDFAVKIDSFLNGRKFDLNEIYTIATNSFRAEKIINETGISAEIEQVRKDWFSAFLAYLDTAPTSHSTASGRLTLKPEGWTQNALRREIPIILHHRNHRHR
jgi:hypothetical protein